MITTELSVAIKNGKMKDRHRKRTLLIVVNIPTKIMMVSGSNTSKKESCFPSFIARPDGRIAAKLERNKAGVLIFTVDMNKQFEDPSYFGRQRFV